MPSNRAQKVEARPRRGGASRNRLVVAKPSTPRRRRTKTQPKQYVGIDLHRRRSVIVRRSAEGETLDVVRVDNEDLLAFEKAVMAAGENPEVVLEASYGWYWATDLLQELGLPDPPGAPAREQLGKSPGEERHPRR